VAALKVELMVLWGGRRDSCVRNVVDDEGLGIMWSWRWDWVVQALGLGFSWCGCGSQGLREKLFWLGKMKRDWTSGFVVAEEAPWYADSLALSSANASQNAL